MVAFEYNPMQEDQHADEVRQAGATVEDRERLSMDVATVIRSMIKASGKSGRQVSREIGRSDSFLSASLAQGVCPRVNTLARVAHACGFQIVIIPEDKALEASEATGGFVIEYDGN